MYKITCGGMNLNVEDVELLRVLTDELGYSNDGAFLLKRRIDSGGSYDASNVLIVKA